ncbi:amidohydrolase [Sphingomonas ginkgonis]|uniref:Amidohydrolase n=1 Tax=Sphingomonas ginkgonis TaxID=2315330 RepID=A0A429VC98_9SPHN|nr:amidohydrolase family protein [Sphingomonas ginkgonis]RST31517.1 amidohydrolase [Sphingomonas ginkgonis]
MSEAGSRIDAHQHFWTLARGDYHWLGPELAIHRDYGPADLAPHLSRHNIGRTILVQAAPTLAETRFLLDLARATPFVAGVVGWFDFEAPDASEQLTRLATDPLLRGVRPMLQDIADEGWILRPAFESLLRKLARRDLAFDALITPRHLTILPKLLDRHPGLRIVIDHGAKPAIENGGLGTWASGMRALADYPELRVKLSGLVTEAGPDWNVERLRPYVDVLLDCFGPNRLMWGSDWPVLELAASYDRWCEATDRLLDPLATAERTAILGGTAERFYRLP